MALYFAIGIIGATVMPHNLYLHSALVQTRKIGDDIESKRKAIKWNFIDSAIALNLALFVNAAILILAGSAFYDNGLTEIASIEEAHRLLEPLVGHRLAPILFAIALIAAGQSSTVTGTLAGQIVMEGYLQIRLNPWMRRLITRAVAVVPAYLTILFAGENKMTDLLVLSQVILSVQLAFAIIPLIFAVADKTKMGVFAIKPFMIGVVILITGIILFLNIKMIGEMSMAFFQTNEKLLSTILVAIGLVLFAVLLLVTIIYPLLKKPSIIPKQQIHKSIDIENLSTAKEIKRIALALDFSEKDKVVMSYGLQHAKPDTEFILIHVVESAGAKILGRNAADMETKHDEEQLALIETFFREKGYKTASLLGFRARASEIARITTEQQADLLILGAHGHQGFWDMIYGETIDAVRHKLSIPILIVK
jgi:manganese transport protein